MQAHTSSVLYNFHRPLYGQYRADCIWHVSSFLDVTPPMRKPIARVRKHTENLRRSRGCETL